MGWSFSMDRNESKSDYIARNCRYSPGYTILRESVVGNHVWHLVQASDGTKFISLFLLSRGNGRHGSGCSDHGWGHKGMSEDMGPYYFDCPLSLLDEAGPTNNHEAKCWREEVRRHHAAKAQRKAAHVAGSVVRFNGEDYRLVDDLKRKGWKVTRVRDGRVFRLPVSYLARAEPVAA